MQGATAEYLIREAAKSGELAAALDLVGEASARGERKCAAFVCRDLARTVVCRAYAPTLLELANLVVAAEACEPRPGRYESLFWSTGVARPSSFRAFVEERLLARGDKGGDVAMTDAGITITYFDGTFSITFARMPFLSAMMEFLVTVIGYAELDDLWGELFRAGPSRERVSKAASRLSKMVYEYLKAHLSAAQEQRNFNRLVSFLRQRGVDDFGPQDITDSVILDFWLAQDGKKGGLDFKTYAAVFRVFLRLRQALESSQDLSALKTATAIGSDREAGEVDPAAIAAALEIVDEPVDLLAALAASPNGPVKFLTNRERAELTLLLECGSLAGTLLLSFLRCEIFAPTQSRLIQARRRGSRAPEFRDLIESEEGPDFEARMARFEDLEKQLAKVLGAALYALLRGRRAEAFEIILSLHSSIDVSALSRWLTRSSSGGAAVHLKDDYLERIFLALENPKTINDEIARVVGGARRAFQAISRKGFNKDDLDDDKCIAAFASGAEPLLRIRERLGALFRDFARTRPPGGDWRTQFTLDRETFRGHFCFLYGVPT